MPGLIDSGPLGRGTFAMADPIVQAVPYYGIGLLSPNGDLVINSTGDSKIIADQIFATTDDTAVEQYMVPLNRIVSEFLADYTVAFKINKEDLSSLRRFMKAWSSIVDHPVESPKETADEVL